MLISRQFARLSRFVGRDKGARLPRCILAKVRHGIAKPNFLFRDGSSTTWSDRPLGDNEPKVTTTGWCLCYCCRRLPTELDGAWPRFPWFTEVPNRVLPLKTSLARADYIMSLSTYMAPTYVLSREFQHFVAPATFVFHRAPSWFDKFVSKWRRPLQVTSSAKGI